MHGLIIFALCGGEKRGVLLCSHSSTMRCSAKDLCTAALWLLQQAGPPNCCMHVDVVFLLNSKELSTRHLKASSSPY